MSFFLGAYRLFIGVYEGFFFSGDLYGPDI